MPEASQPRCRPRGFSDIRVFHVLHAFLVFKHRHCRHAPRIRHGRRHVHAGSVRTRSSEARGPLHLGIGLVDVILGRLLLLGISGCVSLALNRRISELDEVCLLMAQN